jgi:ribonuclease E
LRWHGPGPHGGFGGLSALRLIEEEAAKGKGTVITLFASQEAAVYVLNAKRLDLGEIENRYGVVVEVIPEGENEGAKMRVVSSGPRNEFVPKFEPLILEEDLDDLPEEDFEDEIEEEAEEAEGETGGEGANESAETRRKRRKRRRGRGRDRREEGTGEESQAETSEGEEADEGEEGDAEAPVEAGEEGPRKRRRRKRRRSRNRGEGEEGVSEEQVKQATKMRPPK